MKHLNVAVVWENFLNHNKKKSKYNSWVLLSDIDVMTASHDCLYFANVICLFFFRNEKTAFTIIPTLFKFLIDSYFYSRNNNRWFRIMSVGTCYEIIFFSRMLKIISLVFTWNVRTDVDAQNDAGRIILENY